MRACRPRPRHAGLGGRCEAARLSDLGFAVRGRGYGPGAIDLSMLELGIGWCGGCGGPSVAARCRSVRRVGDGAQAAAVQPLVGWWRSPRMARRARLTAAASRLKSASTCGCRACVFVVRRAAANEVADLAFDLGAGRAVVGLPVGVALPAARGGQVPLVAGDLDGAPAGGVGALRPQRAIGAGGAERGLAVAVAVAADADGGPGGAGDGVVVEVDVEGVLGEPSAAPGRRLGLAARVDAGISQVAEELARAVRGASPYTTGPPPPSPPPPSPPSASSPRSPPPSPPSVRSSMRSAATLASPALPAVTWVSVMISLSGSTATWPL